MNWAERYLIKSAVSPLASPNIMNRMFGALAHAASMPKIVHRTRDRMIGPYDLFGRWSNVISRAIYRDRGMRLLPQFSQPRTVLGSRRINPFDLELNPGMLRSPGMHPPVVEMSYSPSYPFQTSAGRTITPVHFNWLQSYGDMGGGFMRGFHDLMKGVDYVNKTTPHGVTPYLSPGRAMSHPTDPRRYVDALSEVWSQISPERGGMNWFHGEVPGISGTRWHELGPAKSPLRTLMGTQPRAFPGHSRYYFARFPEGVNPIEHGIGAPYDW